ncbi:MAG: DNA polymerase III subunit chi [Hyphomicrobiales bacterium]|nr:MAG: DNA polymerase III subunit chi [Hyphomicrobiales bacterium]
MAEILFYHLQSQPLDEVLPGLLERSLERSWKVIIKSGSPQYLDELDALLWTYQEESFLPHGIADGSENDAKQPILLLLEDSAATSADVLFLVHGAAMPDDLPYQRVVLIFDGQEELALQNARMQWKSLRDSEHDITYWRQNEAGRWEKKA